MFTFGDLFAGIGGMRIAFEKEGFACKWSCENDKYARTGYKKLFSLSPRSGEIFDGDITEVDIDKIPAFDILVAGFPCQSFSLAGRRKGFNDTRGTLFFNIAEILKVKQPRAFLLENVKGLLSNDSGKTFVIIIKTLKELGYHVHHTVLNGNGWVPQNRERVFIVGFRENIAFSFPKQPPPVESTISSILEEQVNQKFFLTDKQIQKIARYLKSNKGQKNLKRIMNTEYSGLQFSDERITSEDSWQNLKSLEQHCYALPASRVKTVINRLTNANTSHLSKQLIDSNGLAPSLTSGDKRIREVIQIQKLLPPSRRIREQIIDSTGHSSTLTSEHEQVRIQNLSLSNYFQHAIYNSQGQAPTLTTNHGAMNVTIDPSTWRKLTPTEYFRLQGFPEEKITLLLSVLSNSQLYRLAGNSVVVPCIAAIARQMKKALIANEPRGLHAFF
jgi:DNA (cytosine-5)-methyltransferase 1